MFARVLLVISAAGALYGQVTFDRILHADKEPQNWLTYSGSTLSPEIQPADADYSRQRQESPVAMGIPGPIPREI